MLGPETAFIAGIVFLASLVGSTSGFGFALLAVPALSLVTGPTDAVVLANALSPVHSFALAFLLRSHIEWRVVRRLLASGMIGMPLGLGALIFVSPGLLRVIIAVTVLAGVVVLWRGLRIKGGGLALAATGFISGLLKTSTGINGPPVVLYLQGTGVEPISFRATLATFILASSALAVVALTAGGQVKGEVAVQSAIAVPAAICGLLLGNRLFERLRPSWFRSMVLLLLLGSAAVTLLSAFI